MANNKKKNRPTPMPIKTAFDILFYLSGIWALIAPSFPDIGEHTLYEISRWSSIIIVVMKFTIVYFGFDYKEVKAEKEAE